jgi:hypothetical protein
MSEDIALLGRQFNRILKKVGRRSRPNVQNIQLDISKQVNTSRNPSTTGDEGNQGKCVRCYECEGFGHIKSECATYIKRQEKGLTASWSDEDNSDNEMETENHVSVMTAVCSSSIHNEKITYEELAASSKGLCIRSKEVCRTVKNQ